MNQEQLSQIFEDICVHGRQVEGWFCENQDGQHTLADTKRGGRWERNSRDEAWRPLA